MTTDILIAGAVFRFSEFFRRILGKAGMKIISKIASLFLASIAVMIVRKGVIILISGNSP